MALAGLVADYSDSSDDEETTAPVGGPADSAATAIINKSTDFFSGTQSDSSDSEDNQPGSAASKPEVADVLPNPLADGAGKGPTLPSSLSVLNTAKGTVFGNRFADQERAKLAIYEKHVKMTEDRTSTRPPCFKFKRGACRKGKGCRFSHDLGFQAPSAFVDDPHAETSANGEVDEPPQADLSTKKRAGVTNTLLPAKKAKQALAAQRASERPWTVGHKH